MTLSRFLPWLLLSLIALAAAFLVQGKSAGAFSLLDVQLKAPAVPVAPGAEALFLVYAVGEPAELDKLQYSVEGGSIAGVVALNETAPGFSEGAVYVRRESAGEATLVVSHLGQPVTAGTARFVPHASIRIEVASDAPAGAAARTWSFDVLDARNAVIARLIVPIGGEQPTASAATGALPAGSYSVRPSASTDAAPSCSGGSLFALTGSAAVTLNGEPALVPFALMQCPIDEVRGARSGPDPLPPATGNSAIEARHTAPPWLPALVALSISLALASAPVAAAAFAHRQYHD